MLIGLGKAYYRSSLWKCHAMSGLIHFIITYQSQQMSDQDCIKFLQSCLPQLGYQWTGFHRVRKQVCKRIQKRLVTLNLPNCSHYYSYLEQNAEEWKILDSFCYITISRFYRDRKVFEILQHKILPSLAQNAFKEHRAEIRSWSAGCCSGEEPYTLQILWHLDLLPKISKRLQLQLVATEQRSDLISRAKRGQYPKSSLKDLPKTFREEAFIQSESKYILKNYFKTDVRFFKQDIRQQLPDGSFDLILCRNLVSTYFQQDLQLKLLEKFIKKLRPNGFFVLGANESLTPNEDVLEPYLDLVGKSIYKKNKY